jgi:hypothetical protein
MENYSRALATRGGGGDKTLKYITAGNSTFRTTLTSRLASMYYIFSGLCPGRGCVPWVGLDTQLSAHYWAQLGAVSTEFMSLS